MIEGWDKGLSAEALVAEAKRVARLLLEKTLAAGVPTLGPQPPSLLDDLGQERPGGGGGDYGDEDEDDNDGS